MAAKAFRALADRGINIRAITTSEIKFSVLIDSAYTELAVRTLHRSTVSTGLIHGGFARRSGQDRLVCGTRPARRAVTCPTI